MMLTINVLLVLMDIIQNQTLLVLLVAHLCLVAKHAQNINVLHVLDKEIYQLINQDVSHVMMYYVKLVYKLHTLQKDIQHVLNVLPHIHYYQMDIAVIVSLLLELLQLFQLYAHVKQMQLSQFQLNILDVKLVFLQNQLEHKQHVQLAHLFAMFVKMQILALNVNQDILLTPQDFANNKVNKN